MGKKRRYTNGYMVYGCSECGRGFRMFLEENLETGGPDHKPVPFTITCPFCGKPDCRDVSFKKEKLSRQRITPGMPAFINVKGDSCGVPMNLERARVEYAMGERAKIVMAEEAVREKLIPVLKSGHCKKIVTECYRDWQAKYNGAIVTRSTLEFLEGNVRASLIVMLEGPLPEYDPSLLTVKAYMTEDGSTCIDVEAKYSSDEKSGMVQIHNSIKKENPQ